jgi:hypothetical protein
VSVSQFILVVAVGAAAIALWLDVRLDARTPRTVGWTFIHTAGAIFGLTLMPKLVALIVAGTDSPARKLIAVVAVLIPAFTYCSLAAIWLLKLVQRHAHLRP